MAIDVRELFLSKEDDENNDYKSGWNDAVCWMNDMYVIQDRNWNTLQISFNIDIDENEIVKLLEKKNDKTK